MNNERRNKAPKELSSVGLPTLYHRAIPKLVKKYKWIIRNLNLSVKNNIYLQSSWVGSLLYEDQRSEYS